MERIALVEADWIDPEEPGDGLGRGTLLIEDGRLAGSLPPGRMPGEAWRRVSAPGPLVCPGFVDLHFHGELVNGRAEDFGEALDRASARLAAQGTTTFLATTLTWSRESLPARFEALAREVARPRPEGAACTGIHLEGPWIRAEAAGAHVPGHTRPYDPAKDPALLDVLGESLRMVTLAPELEGADALLGELERRGALAAIGHTLASAEEIDRAVAGGARHVTHLYNAMGPWHQRAPGVAGHVLARDALHCDLICDGHHVHPDVVKTAVRALGRRLVLISDRVDPPGWRSDDPDEPVRLADGTLAGSQLGLDRALRHVRDFAGLSLREAVAAVTLRPARLLALEREIGTLRRGARADLAFLDRCGRVVSTWRGGRSLWTGSDARAATS